MSSAAEPSYVLIRRLADGTVEWIPLEASPQGVPVAPKGAYTLVDRADYEAPHALVVQRLGDDLVVKVNGTDVLVLNGFYAAADVAFYPTTNVAAGGGPFTGSPLTPDSPVLAGSAAGEQVVWSAGKGDSDDKAGGSSEETGAGGATSSGTSPMLWVGLAAGGVGLAAAAGGGGGGSSGGGSSGPVADITAPQITSGSTAAIAENGGTGQVVYTVTATDARAITYSLKAGGDAASFAINPNSGAVTLTANPNFEAKASYNFTVVATDAANNSAELAVSLAINNRDEVAPTITSSATATAINENSGPGQVVYTVTSTDTDIVTGSTTTYSLKAGGDAAAFTINANTGALTLTGNPDFETKASYNFTVVATDAGSNSSEKAVSLAINNLADTPVTITSGGTAAPIDENSGGAHVVYAVAAVSTTPGPLTYSLKPGGDAAAFTINVNTGVVTLTGNPDFEAKPSYNFTVVATDRASNTGEQPVSLAINNRDEVAPTITSGATAPPLNENTGPGQVVYTVTSTDTGDISTGSTIYSIKAVGDSSAFTIDSITGAVSFTPNPDFETKTSYNFTVVATDAAGNRSEKALTLLIIDRDEVAPTITSGPATPINENSGAGQVIYTVTATDTDAVTYSVKAGVGDAAAFSINGANGQVTLIGNPNFEVQPSYNFTVVATDAALNSSERPVVLTIKNRDEVPPTITSGATALAINENSGAGQVVYTVTSTDADVVSGSTTYSKAGVDAALFGINASSGAVTLIGNPNFETKSSYSFTVVATDAAGNSSAPQAVSLAINNRDEVAPTITSGATAPAINENSGAGQVVYTVTSTDADVVSGSTTYSKAGVDAALFGIDASSGAVTLIGDPNFETKSSYSFTVVATDAAGNSSAPRAVSLAINNRDEVAPTITSGATAPAINENSGAGQVVYTVTSTDADVVSGSTTYSKAGVDAALFGIDASSGAVTLIGDPNFETKSSYSFTVVATDAAGNSSAPRAVSLAINNRDEVAPTVTSGATAPAINENSGAGQVVYTVTSTDADVVSGSTTYSKAGVDAALFGINASSGAVTLTGNPNFETKSSYSFTVVATDAAGNSSAPQAVSLAINNRDEVAPTITSGGIAPAINENSGAGQVVYTVASTDIGDGSTGVTTYSKAGVDAALFGIDASSGAVTLIGDPNFETKSSYSFTVVATDAAGNSSAPRAVSLAINNRDEVAPTITSGATAPAISENSGAGQVVYTVTSTDADVVSGSTTYSKAGVDAALFGIDASSGAVTLIGDPNFETKSSYSFTVVATDAAGNSSAPRAVSLAINNRDEVAPTITSGATAPAITENSGANQLVYTVTSTDADVVSGSTTYSLTGVDAAAFNINSTSGAVRLTANPNFEDQSSYSFTVVATDGGNNSGTQAVSLGINDIADETPPAVGHIGLTGAIGGQNGTLNANDIVSVTVTMTENTLVNTSGGIPSIELSIGVDRVDATYVSGSGTPDLIFQYTIQSGENDNSGISLRSNTLALNGGSIADAAGNVADLGHGPVGNNPSFVVDTTAPTLSSSTPADGAPDFPRGDDIVLTFSENVLAGSGSIVINGGLDFRTIDVNDPQISISGNQVTINPTFDLAPASPYSVQIDGTALTDIGGTAFAGISNTTTLNFETNFIFPFGLAQDSSSVGSRTFQSPVSEGIDIRVAVNEPTLSDSGSASWSGSAKLGSDDRATLAASDTGSVSQMSIIEAAVAWQAGADAESLHGTSLADPTRFGPSTPGASPDDGAGQTNITSFANMPAVMLTSQGLA